MSNAARCVKKNVTPQRVRRTQIVQACVAIGWDGKERNCGELGPVKLEYERLKATKCKGNRNVKRIREEIAALNYKIRVIEGIAGGSASNAPRVKKRK